MDDRLFWEAMRRALLMMVAAIERRHGLGQDAPRRPRFLDSDAVVQSSQPGGSQP